MSDSLRVIVVDDDSIVLSSIPDLIRRGQGEEATPRIEVAGQASNGEDAIALVRKVRPDVVLMDLQMPGRVTGADAIRTILNGLEPPKVLALTAFDDEKNIRAALAAGANGYLLKAKAAEDVVSSILAVARGETVTSPAVTEKLVADFLYEDPRVTDARERIAMLEPNERTAARLVGYGKTYEQIGAQLHLSGESVKKLLREARKKAGAYNSAELAMLLERARLD